jgi:hypothetical protein
MSFFRTRKPKSAPQQPSREAVAAGLTTFAADLLAGDLLAVDSIGPLGEMPMDAREWAAYPTDPYRMERLAHFGGPSADELPDTAAATENAATPR